MKERKRLQILEEYERASYAGTVIEPVKPPRLDSAPVSHTGGGVANALPGSAPQLSPASTQHDDDAETEDQDCDDHVKDDAEDSATWRKK
jgi:hypothetical protein